MKIRQSILLLTIGLFFTACNKEKREEQKKENNFYQTEQEESFVKDSFTYYNGNQKQIEVNKDQYFGFGFESEGQDLKWELDPNLSSNLTYISEVYEAEADSKNNKIDGKQFYTFKAVKPGNIKVKFKSNFTDQVKEIEIHIK